MRVFVFPPPAGVEEFDSLEDELEIDAALTIDATPLCSALPPANLVAVRLTVALGGLNGVDGLTALPLPPRSGE